MKINENLRFLLPGLLKIHRNPPWELAGRPQICPELAGRAPDLRNLENPRKMLDPQKIIFPAPRTEKNVLG